MVASLSFNPMQTTNANGSFSVDTNGLIQGTAYDSPNARNNLAGGILATTETIPMWGGVGITESITNPTTGVASSQMGNLITRATSLTLTNSGALNGFTVFDQAHHMIETAQSPVPVSLSGMSVHFYRLGSGARIAVACEPGLTSLLGGVIGAQVSWNFTGQYLQEYVSGASISVTSLTWSNTNGGQVAVVAAATTPYVLNDTIEISGATNTGTGSLVTLNGPQVINTWTDSTHFTFLLPGTSSIWGTLGGTIILVGGGGALNVQVLDVQVGNSMAVNYNALTNVATWNRTGSCAVISI
jgi:hypothetical protein